MKTFPEICQQPRRSIHRHIIGLLLLLALTLQACATQNSYVSHGFYFDGKFGDGWEEYVDLLAYDYGGKYPMVRNDIDSPRSAHFRNLDRLPSSTGVNGPMPVGDYLYVKWRLRSTGQLLEDRVDLKGRLPVSMLNQRLTFVIDGERLYVFIVTDKPKRYSGEPPILKTSWSRTYQTYEIYPSLNRPLN
jgi:hypothetical protein